MSTTTERLIRLVERGEVNSQSCAGRLLGVTRARVQQIVAKEGLKLGVKPQPNTLIEWPCPDCGKPVQMWTRARHYRKTARCASCSTRRAKEQEYCHRGHLMAKTRRRHPNGATHCLLCNRINAREYYQRKKAK